MVIFVVILVLLEYIGDTNGGVGCVMVLVVVVALKLLVVILVIVVVMMMIVIVHSDNGINIGYDSSISVGACYISDKGGGNANQMMLDLSR